MVSIGKPEVGKQLVQHLGLTNGEEYLFVDPTNALYDELDLNRGIQSTFFNPATPFSFLDRFTKKEGMKELWEVLGKWNKALYIPPKLEQGYLQGGTFIFQGSKTILAHYDEGTGAHAKPDNVMELVTQTALQTSEARQ